MTLIIFFLMGLALFAVLVGLLFGRRRRRAENILGPDGWPKPETRNGFRPNNEE